MPRFVRKRALPWPPEPIRALGVALAQRAMARADRNQGRRGPWLKLLDALGVGFDAELDFLHKDPAVYDPKEAPIAFCSSPALSIRRGSQAAGRS